MTARLAAPRLPHMRSHSTLVAALMLVPAPGAAQAPAWVDLWRVADGTAALPLAAATGPVDVFWNPAAVAGGPGFAAGIDVVQTPDVVNVSGVLLGATYGLTPHVGLGALAGRMSVGDLVRTTSSPVSEGAEIPVYAQFIGGSAGGRIGPLTVGLTVLVHDARLDAREDGGVTVDAGVQLAPLPGLRLAAASHLGDPLATHGSASSFLAAAEYAVQTPPLLGLRSAVRFRYGLTSRAVGAMEHQGSGGVLLADRLAVDVGAIWIGGYGEAAWQPALGIAFRAGPYRVGIVRGAGVSGIGAAYRLSLAIGARP